jgi:2,3-bisphosphoglycerate-independent phosphoglycerate mutase
VSRRFRKAVLLIVDGLGDLPNPALDGLTPLEAARTPNLDRMAGRGGFGLADPLARGEVPNTDSGVGLLLGLRPAQADRLRRGPVEAAGAGRPLREGEIAVRANFATLEAQPGGLLVRDRRAGRIDEGTAELASALNGIPLDGGVTATFLSTDQHRGVLILSGNDLDARIGDTDPGDRSRPAFLLSCRAQSEAAAATAERVNAFVAEAHRRLPDHAVNRAREASGLPPATGVITRGAGAWFQLDNWLAERGVRAVTVAGCTTVRGLSRMLGWRTVERPGFTAALDTDLDGKVAAALEALADHDLVFIHVKGPDICAHDRRPEAKRDFLERLDAALGPLAESGAIVALGSDHTTDSNSGAHTADPVPVLLFDPLESAEAPVAVNFSENTCRRGTLPRTSGAGFLERLIARLELPA